MTGLIVLAVILVVCTVAVLLAHALRWWEDRDAERRAQAQRDARDFARYRAGLDLVDAQAKTHEYEGVDFHELRFPRTPR